MRYLLFTLFILSAYNLYETKVLSGKNIKVQTLEDIERKLKTATVNSEEILTGATDFAIERCKDTHFQGSAGENSASCQNKLYKFKSVCAERVFGKELTQYSDKYKVSSLANRFVRCVST